MIKYNVERFISDLVLTSTFKPQVFIERVLEDMVYHVRLMVIEKSPNFDTEDETLP